MLIIFFFFCIIIIGICFSIYSFKRFYNAVPLLVGFFTISFGVILFMGLLETALDTQINNDIDFQNIIMERDILIYRIEKGEDLPGYELLHSQIMDFNADLRETKECANNPWFNWFYNKKIAEKIDYIEYEENNTQYLD